MRDRFSRNKSEIKLKSDVDRSLQRFRGCLQLNDKNDWFTFTLKKMSLIEAVKHIHILLA